MREYPHSLEKGSRKFPCPKCDHNTFVRYVDNTTGEYCGDFFGRCDREQQCMYHVPPPTPERGRFIPKLPQKEVSPDAMTFSTMPAELLEKSARYGSENYFVQFLKAHFEPEAVLRVIGLYRIGSSKHWKRATVFWQIDRAGRIRAGKIMQFNHSKGNRVKVPYNRIQWVHAVLKLPGYQMKQCFFGEHLLNDQSKPVAIVESEKTALICAIVKPDSIWLATGGKMNLKADSSRCLHGRTVTVYPDLGAFEDWSAKANVIKTKVKCSLKVSDSLERIATESEREQGLDIADFILKGVKL